jgi:transposase
MHNNNNNNNNNFKIEERRRKVASLLAQSMTETETAEHSLVHLVSLISWLKQLQRVGIF